MMRLNNVVIYNNEESKVNVKKKINLPKKMKRSNEEIRQRREEILHYLKENGRTEINDLSKYFNVSEMTIRRDCAKLSEMGQIIQPFGYVEIFQEVEGQKK